MNFLFVIYILNVVVGFANLSFYAWGSHETAALALGIACLFAATWCRQETQ